MANKIRKKQTADERRFIAPKFISVHNYIKGINAKG
jgi:hypothetical protein